VNVLKNSAANLPTLYGCIGNTLADVFPSLYSINLDSGNSIFLAFNDNISLVDLKRKLQDPSLIPTDLQKLTSASASRIAPYPDRCQFPYY